jgi:uncharacterized membrane protein (DUF4010 family)
LLALLTWFAPVAPIDPWQLLSLKKIATMIFALAVIQAFGSTMTQYLGMRTGALLTGFFGGLISSTATTASLAKRSKVSPDHASEEVLIFLSATGAMLFEALALVITGTTAVHLSNLIIFVGPILATAGMIVIEYHSHSDRSGSSDDSNFQILPILKLSFFIVAILSFSKICQNVFGQNGLLVLTSLVSLFEIHGSVIANVQLHESGVVSVRLLCSLLAVSIVASYVSKLFLISTLGSPQLRSKAVQRTPILFCALAVSWAVALSIH